MAEINTKTDMEKACALAWGRTQTWLTAPL